MKLEDFKNKYKNKIGFIIGAGPSLVNIDMEPLKNHITFAVNSGIVKAPWSLFYVSDDLGASTWSYHKNLSKLDCTCFLYKDKLENRCQHIDKNRVVLFKHTWWFSPKDNSYNLDGLKLTKEEPILGSRTSFGSSIHIAHIMGCNPIVLIGNDCSFDKNNKRYFWEYWPKKNQPYRLYGPKFSERTRSLGFDKKAYIDYWEYFIKVNKEMLENELKIIDCSNSPLGFEKMSIKEVLEKYKGK